MVSRRCAQKLIDSPLDDIQWGDDEVGGCRSEAVVRRSFISGVSQTVFVVTERGKLYRSPDGGKGWTNQVNKL